MMSQEVFLPGSFFCAGGGSAIAAKLYKLVLLIGKFPADD